MVLLGILYRNDLTVFLVFSIKESLFVLHLLMMNYTEGALSLHWFTIEVMAGFALNAV